MFIGYLLNALDERGTRDVEAYLNSHPEARQKLALLQQALEPLASDMDAPLPPPQLTERTLARVAEHNFCGGRRTATTCRSLRQFPGKRYRAGARGGAVPTSWWPPRC